MTSGRWNTGKVFPQSVIEDVSSALTGEHTSFHRCGTNYVVGKFPLFSAVEESSREDLVLAVGVLKGGT